MAYQALARSERPQTFEEVVGQESVTTTLKNAINQRRIGHAYLFTGPRGVGKTSTARILAKALNCLSSSLPTPDPCNQCANCTAITNGNSLDVMEVDGASNRGIEEIRSLRENVKFAPASSRNKIYIIDEVHMLTEQAFNALLKTLEEPPDHVVFMFATTEPRKIPATILSRTQRFDFREITTEDIFQHLRKLVDRQNIPAEDDGLRLIAFKASGSLRDSLSLLDQAIAYGNGTVVAAATGPLLGILGFDTYHKLIDLLLKQDTGAALELLNEAFAQGYGVFDQVNGILAYLRHLLLIKVKAHSLVAQERSEQELTKMRLQTADLSVNRLLQFIQVFLPLENTVKKSGFANILLELAVVKVSEFGAEIPLDEILEKINQLEAKLASGDFAPSTPSPPVRTKAADPITQRDNLSRETTAPPPAAEQPQEDTSVPPAQVQVQWWPIFLERLAADKKHAMLNHLHSHVVKVEQVGEKIILHIDNQTSYNSLKRANSLSYLQAKIRDILGENYSIRCEQIKPKADAGQEMAQSQSNPVEKFPALDDPTLKMVVDKFQGEVVKFIQEQKIHKEKPVNEKYE